MAQSEELLTWLRATAETTRLRLLALCARQESSVSDLAQLLGQSEPRVSRHLKILTEAGLVERLRQGQWVHYHAVQGTPAAAFVTGLLAQLDRSDPVWALGRQHAESSAGAAASPAAARLGRELCSVVEAEPLSSASVLWVGAGQPELLPAVASLGIECSVLAHSRRAAQAIRSSAERQGLACRVWLATRPGELLRHDLARLDRTFDSVFLDQLGVPQGDLPALLSAARTALSAGGRLWLLTPYDSEDGAGQRVVEHPIARLRRRLGEAGFHCESIRPIEAGRHVLVVRATPLAGALSRAG